MSRRVLNTYRAHTLPAYTHHTTNKAFTHNLEPLNSHRLEYSGEMIKLMMETYIVMT